MWNSGTSLIMEQGRHAAVFPFLFLQVFFFPSMFFFYFPLRATGTAQPLPLTAIDPIRVFRRDFFARAPDTSLEANTGRL